MTESERSAIPTSANPDAATENEATAITLTSALGLAAALAALALPVVVDRAAIASAAALYPLGASAHPYWVPDRAVLLYLRAPIVAVSACIFLITPGLLLALAANIGRTVAVWVLAGLMLSIPVVSVVAGVVQTLVGSPLSGRAFVATVAVASICCFSALCYRVVRGNPVSPPWRTPNAKVTTASMVGASLLFLIILAPKFYWDSFNGDGAHTLEAARLLLHQPVPFFTASAGPISAFPGITSSLYVFPESWFVRLFGDIEGSVRLPFVLYLSALFCAIVALAEHKRRPLGWIEHWLIWLGLTVYAITMAYSATYNPYSADIALPATQDTLLMAMFLGYVIFSCEKRPWWTALAIAFTYLSLPSGVVLIVLWLLVAMFWRPAPRRQILQSSAVLAGCIVAGALISRLLAAVGLPPPGREYGVASLLGYFHFLQFTDWHRIGYWIIPGGVVPALAIVGLRRLDRIGRSLALVSIGYFTLFFIQANISLHHFVPAMLLPLVAFWRSAADATGRRRSVLLASAGAGGVIALSLSLPRDAGPYMTSREVGFAIEDRTKGYDSSDAASFRRSQLLAQLFPLASNDRVPERSFGGAPVVWLYYAHHRLPGGPAANYVLQSRIEPAPDRARLVVADHEAAVYVRSDSIWAGHLALRPPTPAGSPAYDVSRGTLFRSERPPEGAHVISVVKVLGSVGIDIISLLRRLGVKR